MQVGTAARAQLGTTARSATGTAGHRSHQAVAPPAQQPAPAPTAATVVRTQGGGSSGKASGNFVSVCSYSHRAMDDPIVHPGVSGASHSHDFFGNASTNANSTLKSLLAAGTTCSNRADTAAYWVPTLAVNGKAATPKLVRAYYRAAVDGRQLQPYPAGLRVVAGTASATTPQPTSIVTWSCVPGPDTESSSVVPTCDGGAHLKLGITFPDCWNGTTLDSADHAGHMAYSAHGACPASHPVALPRLEVYVNYPIAGGPGVTLASGAPLSAHGDFFNAWNQAELTSLVRDCLNAGKLCGPS
jgi:hypothetical protein